jgi:NTP pyrophosphatase (non-canonical NTP hydrolase)
MITLEEGFWNKVNVAGPDECWEWTARKIKSGYGSMKWPTINNPDAQMLGHRLSWMINVGPIPDGSMVLHKCDNKGCVNPNHLFLGNASDNVRDCIAKGRNNPVIGEKQWASKITRIEALHIRHSEDKLYEIAKKYGISKSSARSIKKGLTWKKSDDVLMKMVDEVVSWIHPLLPDRDPFDAAIKLASEVSELQHVLHTKDGDVGAELADCMILLLDLCFLLKVNPDDALMTKMAINRNRNWNKVMGTLKHNKE